LSLDTSTIAGENICALRVKFVDTASDQNDLYKSVRKNQVIGIQSLKESSTAEAFLSLVEDKLLNFGDDIRANLVGLTHDGARCLSGEKGGLIAKMRNQTDQYIYDLIDPCHGLNLALYASLRVLPEDIKNFIDGIHHHFISPQRKAKLVRIQIERGENKLLPKNYVKTRWLSLGESLNRLLVIWGSLISYMKTAYNEEGLKQFDFKYYLNLLEDQAFHLKIIFLSNIIHRINEANIKLQSHTLEIQHLKLELTQLLQWMAKLVVLPEEIPQKSVELMDINWREEDTQQNLYMDTESFIKYISEKIDTRLSGLNEKSIKKKQQKEFVTLFKGFINEVLFQLTSYLPLKDKVIEILDFVTLRGPSYQIEDKILCFNDIFNIFPKQKKPELVKEITTLLNIDLANEMDAAKLSSLNLWDLF